MKIKLMRVFPRITDIKAQNQAHNRVVQIQKALKKIGDCVNFSLLNVVFFVIKIGLFCQKRKKEQLKNYISMVLHCTCINRFVFPTYSQKVSWSCFWGVFYTCRNFLGR